MARMASRYPGSCSICGKRFEAGADIDHDRTTRSASHWECKRTEAPIPAGTKTYDIGGGSGYGCNGWHKGQVLRASKRDIAERAFPSFLYVLRATRQYVREDGLSFGVGDDSGYLYHATCREATPEEAAPLCASERKAEIHRQAKASLAELKREIQEHGDRPDIGDGPQIYIDGERWFDTQSIYGGGDWFELTADHIWYVRNNGSDGDDWRHNNVRTGGAGAIGKRVPRTEARMRILTACRELLGTTVQHEARERELLAMIDDERRGRIVEG